MHKVTLVVSVLMLLVAVGCQDNEVATSPQPAEPKTVETPAQVEPTAAKPTETPTLEPAPAPAEPTPAKAAPAEQEVVMANVNGEPIYMAPLVEMLVGAYGMEQAQHLIASELVRQASTEKGLTATDEEAKAEHDKTINRMFANIKDPAQRENMMKGLLRRRGMSREQWDVTMHRNVLLTKLVLPEVEVSDEEVANLYEQKYGRKLIARHILSNTAADAQVAIDRVKNGESFEVVLKEVSKSPTAAQGGLLPPIGAQSKNIPGPLKDAILALEAVGEISDAVMFQNRFYVLYLDSIVEAQDVKLEYVNEELIGEIKEGKMGATRQKKLGDMIKAADIEYVNPILKEKQDKIDEAREEQKRRQAELEASKEEARKYAEKMIAEKEAAAKEAGGKAEPKTSKEDARKYAEKMIAEKEAAAKEAAAKADDTEEANEAGEKE